ncbi:MAG: glycosyltransferase [Pyrinomonadaceae bacterium]|nr:glycosyltransferase [Pyrinomonadaceae bacterium]
MARKPNVLLMVDSFDIGGGESQTVLLARLLLGDGRYGVHLACIRREGALLDEVANLGVGEVPEFRLTSFYDKNMLVQLRRFVSFLRERQIDVVHPQSFYTNVFAITGAAMARVPARIAFRGDTGGWRSEAQEFVERRWTYRLAHSIHANSDAVKRFLIKSGVPERKIMTVYNGLDMNRVIPQAGISREQVMDRLGLPKQSRKFVTIVANMRHEIKDHPMFLRMAQRVHAAVPEAAFVLAGEGELVQQTKDLASQLGIGQDTFFIGRCDGVAELLSVSDIGVLTSKAEGFSNSILEYMAAALPVVATDVGGAAEAIVPGETGYLVASGDDEQMAERIISLLRDPERSRRMGAQGRERVLEKFSDRAQLKNTTVMYETLLGRKRLFAPQPLENRS